MSAIPNRPQAPARRRLLPHGGGGHSDPVPARGTDRRRDCRHEPDRQPHAAATRRLEQRFARAVADGLLLTSVQNPLRLDPFTEPQPDFVVLRPRGDAYAADGRYASAARLSEGVATPRRFPAIAIEIASLFG